ncbi:MAG: hypothetical protein JW974_00655 [Alphaproteobacteria bacterium]|nr:hypothetical protein [Alphaproteobacteria bacterium]MBN2674956.1 hypothetical protein [Alphaproteobacteria bacterium]
MNDNKNFSYENILMSVVGHLFFVAIMLTSFALVIEHAKLVAPDRVQITEIDLTQVKITGDETLLYNTDFPDVKESKKEETKDKKAEPELGDDKPIEKPSMVQPDKKKKTEKKENKPVPKKKMIVRVNRETVSLNRTMTVSVVDALRVALTRCWTVDTTRDDITDIRAVAHLTMYKNGIVRDVWFESAARSETDPAFSYVLDTIRSALKACQPFRMLPVSEFDNWEKIQLTFYPTSGKIM